MSLYAYITYASPYKCACLCLFRMALHKSTIRVMKRRRVLLAFDEGVGVSLGEVEQQ